MQDVRIRVVADRGMKASCSTEVYINDFKVPGLADGTTASVELNRGLHTTILTLRFPGNRLELEDISAERRSKLISSLEARSSGGDR